MRFSPVNPHHVLLGTGDGYALLLDLRTPHFPLYHLSLSMEPVAALYWPACRPDLYVAATASSVRSHSLLLRPDRALSLRGLPALPVAPYSTCWALAVVEDAGNAVLFTAFAWSDGNVHAVSHAWDDMEKDGRGRSAGLSVTRPRPGAEGLEVVDGVEVALGNGRNRSLRESRIKEAGSAMKAEELALDDRLAMRAVAANPKRRIPAADRVGRADGDCQNPTCDGVVEPRQVLSAVSKEGARAARALLLYCISTRCMIIQYPGYLQARREQWDFLSVRQARIYVIMGRLVEAWYPGNRDGYGGSARQRFQVHGCYEW